MLLLEKISLIQKKHQVHAIKTLFEAIQKQFQTIQNT